MNCITSFPICLIFVFCFSCDGSPTNNQNGTTNEYPNSGRSIGESGCSATDIIKTSNGNYVLVGTKYFTDPQAPLVTQIDAYVMKITANGDSLWKRNFGAFDADHGNSVVETTDGGLMIGMTTIYTQETSIHYDVSALKSNSNGQIQWKKSFFGLWTEFYGAYVQTAADGGYTIAGTSTVTGNTSYDVTLVHINSSGDSLWTKSVVAAGNDYVTDLIRTNDGGYVILGNDQSLGISGFIIKTDANGEQQWTKSYGLLSNGGKITGAQTADDGFILCATKLINGNENFYLIKTNSTGDTLWTRTYGGVGVDQAHRVRLTSDGGFILAGVTNSYGHLSGYDAYLVKTNAQGDTTWTRTYGGPLNDYAYSVIETTDHGFILAGETENFGGGIFFVRTDSLGNELN